MAARRSSGVLTICLLVVALATMLGGVSFLQPPAKQTLQASAATLMAQTALVAGPAPALAGEPPSVGDHWYWNLGFGSLHGETASIILLVFFLYVVFSLLGAGGSSKKSA